MEEEGYRSEDWKDWNAFPGLKIESPWGMHLIMNKCIGGGGLVWVGARGVGEVPGLHPRPGRGAAVCCGRMYAWGTLARIMPAPPYAPGREDHDLPRPNPRGRAGRA